VNEHPEASSIKPFFHRDGDCAALGTGCPSRSKRDCAPSTLTHAPRALPSPVRAGGAHMMTLEDPGKVAAAVAKFLNA